MPLSHNSTLHFVHNQPLPISHIVLKLTLVILAIVLVEELTVAMFLSFFKHSYILALVIVENSLPFKKVIQERTSIFTGNVVASPF